MCASVKLLTLLASKEPLNSLNEFVPVTVGIYTDLLQLLVTHVCEYIQWNLPGDKKLKKMHLISFAFAFLHCCKNINW